MKYYPVFFDLREKVCLVVGGGAVSERKVQRLLECDASVRVVSKSLSAGLQCLLDQKQIQCPADRYFPNCLDGVFLVICATDDKAMNEQVMRDCRSRGIPVNVVDDPELCDFILPSIVEQGDLTIAVSTGGKSPALAKCLREELECRYDRIPVNVDNMGRLAEGVYGESRPTEETGPFCGVVYTDILELLRREDLGRRPSQKSGATRETGK